MKYCLSRFGSWSPREWRCGCCVFFNKKLLKYFRIPCKYIKTSCNEFFLGVFTIEHTRNEIFKSLNTRAPAPDWHSELWSSRSSFPECDQIILQFSLSFDAHSSSTKFYICTSSIFSHTYHVRAHIRFIMVHNRVDFNIFEIMFMD